MKINKFGCLLPLRSACGFASLRRSSIRSCCWSRRRKLGPHSTATTPESASARYQINQSTIKNLRPAWIHRVSHRAKRPDRSSAERRRRTGRPVRLRRMSSALRSNRTPLVVNGVLYFTTPDNAWAVDARSGHELWHYFWRTKGGIHIGNRGVGMYGNWLYL